MTGEYGRQIDRGERHRGDEDDEAGVYRAHADPLAIAKDHHQCRSIKNEEQAADIFRGAGKPDGRTEREYAF